MKPAHFTLRNILIAVFGLTATACSTVGEKHFACPGRPPGVRCMSATEVYSATHNTDFVEPTSTAALGDEPSVGAKAPKHRAQSNVQGEKRMSKPMTPRESGQSANTDLIRTEVLTPSVERPIPIRTPAQVMRAWIAPWEDTRGVLHAGSYAFVEVESRRWSFGETTTAEPVRFFSIQKPVEAKETVGKDRGVPTARAGTSERSERSNSSTLPKTGASK